MMIRSRNYLTAIVGCLAVTVIAAPGSNASTARTLSLPSSDLAGSSANIQHVPLSGIAGDGPSVNEYDASYERELATSWQNDFSFLVDRIRKTQAGIFAKSEIVGDSATVYFTEAPPASVIEELDSFNHEVSVQTDSVMSESAAALAAELAIKAARNSFPRSAMVTSTDPASGQVDITVAEVATPALVKLVPSASVGIDIALEALTPGSPKNPVVSIHFDPEAAVQDTISYGNPGGWRLDEAGTDNFQCTSAFVVKSRTTTELGALTAGHCIDNLSQSGRYNFQYKDQERGANGDYQWMRSPQMMDAWFHANFSEGRPVYGATTGGEGVYLCRFGRSSGRDCGTIVDLDECTTPSNGGGITYCGLTVVNRLEKQSNIPGDSGGPWYKDNIAHGVAKGKSTDGTLNYFTPMHRVLGGLRVYICRDVNGEPKCTS